MREFEVETTGRSVDEAVELALAELGVGRDQVEVEILEEVENRGFLGIVRHREVRVRVRRKESRADLAAEFVRQVGDLLELPLKVTAAEDAEKIAVDVEGVDLGLLIGRRGQTLEALQYLTNAVVNRVSRERRPIVVDVQGYRRRRGEALERLARRMAERAVRTGREVVLEPMTPQDRRIVHLALQGHSRVATASEGEEPFRKVVITPLK